MKRVLILLFIGGLFCTSSFGQSDKVKISQVKGWVEKVPFEVTAAPPADEAESYYYLLVDEQENFSAQELYSHYAYKILTSEGLQQMSDISISFDPAYEQVTVHGISIHRGGQVIDKLPKSIKTIQREASMERYIYDGSLTAVINLPDVRVGDVIEYSFTHHGYNPVHKDHIDRRFFIDYTAARIFHQITIPKSMKVSVKNFNSDTEPQKRESNGTVTYTWSREKVKSPAADSNYPDWYNPYQRGSISSYQSWAEVSAWANTLFTVKESDKQRLQHEAAGQFKTTDPEEYTAAVIRFVQDEVRYLGFESGLNTHMPYPPLQVYTQRFGDCKDKSLLLVTLLNARGIEAHPVLVNTNYRHKVSDLLPSAYAFDHCVTQIKLNGRTFYIDPTINGQGGKASTCYFPMYGKGLVIDGSSTDFAEFGGPAPSSILESQTYTLAAIGGDAVLNIKTTYSGVEADVIRAQWERNGSEDLQKSYLEFYGNLYPDIEKADDISFTDDRDKNIAVVEEHYRVPKFWSAQEDNADVQLASFRALSLGTYFDVPAFAKRTAPYSVNYPLDYTVEMHVDLPEEWTISDNDEHIKSDYYDYSYTTKYDAKKLFLKTHYVVKQSSIPADQYQQYVTDHKTMWDNLTYSISYNSKVSSTLSAQWPGNLLTIVSLIGGIIGILWIYGKYDPQPYYPSGWAEPIGGWLVLVAIGLTISPVMILYSVISEDLLTGSSWLVFFYQGNYGWGLFLVFEHVYNVVIIVYSLLAIALFYQRRSSAPRIVSIFYGVVAVMSIVDNVAASILTGQNMDADGVKQIFRSVISAAIWIPYFYTSQRVKKTFVFTYADNSNPDETGDTTVPAEETATQASEGIV